MKKLLALAAAGFALALTGCSASVPSAAPDAAPTVSVSMPVQRVVDRHLAFNDAGDPVYVVEFTDPSFPDGLVSSTWVSAQMWASCSVGDGIDPYTGDVAARVCVSPVA